MTEKRLKELLRIINKMQTQIALWEKYMKVFGNASVKIQIEKETMRLNFIICAINILASKERFVIENHLINHRTWDETTVLFEEQWGRENGRSDRTLKRIQAQALSKMTDFINESMIEQLFDM